MIDYDGLKQIMAEWDGLEHNAEGRNRWWREHGVDPDGITKLCTEEAGDDLGNIMIARPFPFTSVVLVGASLSMAYEVGIMYGMLLARKAAAA